MQLRFVYRILFSLGLSVFFLACNNSDKKEKEVIKQDTSIATPPPTTAPPKVELTAVQASKCFDNMGLKYNTTIELHYLTDSTVMGSATSLYLETSNVETSAFEGVVRNDLLIIKFKANPPVIGDASEWTDKPWKIAGSNKKEKLLIPFHAKNYETGKWQDMNYEFEPCSEK